MREPLRGSNAVGPGNAEPVGMTSACVPLSSEEGSIYDRGVGPGHRGREARRRRTHWRHRLTSALAESGVNTDRASPLREVLRAAAEGVDVGPQLEARLAIVRAEVETLEALVLERSPGERKNGASIRRALELLRRFGRASCLDLSVIEEPLRPLLVTWLALEHRWCYAAAGTDRRSFKRATGRTGAR